MTKIQFENSEKSRNGDTFVKLVYSNQAFVVMWDFEVSEQLRKKERENFAKIEGFVKIKDDV